MLQTTSSTAIGVNDGFGSFVDIANLTDEPARRENACTVLGSLEELFDTFTRKDIKALAV